MAVAVPHEIHLRRTRLWQGRTVLVRESHSRGGAARHSFGADTVVAVPHEIHLARTRLWQGRTVLMRESHDRGWPK